MRPASPPPSPPQPATRNPQPATLHAVRQPPSFNTSQPPYLPTQCKSPIVSTSARSSASPV
eukprot:47221-Chlamydomonas_euryale.AAC.1